MRRIFVVLGVAVVMAAIVALAAGTALAQANDGATSIREPFTAEGFNPCNGETYFVEGFLHFVSNTTVDSSGTPHEVLHLNQVGVKGVGESGATYSFIATNNINSMPLDMSAGEQTLTLDFRVLRQGRDGTRDDFMGHLTFHVTQNANGELTAEVAESSFECR